MAVIRWMVLFLVLLAVISVTTIILVALVRPKQHEHARKISGYSILDCSYQVLAEGPTYRRHVTRTHEMHVAEKTLEGRVKSVTSKNWAGYVVATDLHAPAKGSVTSVSGTWIVPRILPRKPLEQARYSATWVGIDGYAPKSLTVQQIGTESDWDPVSGQQVNYAWFEIYDQPPRMIVNFPVSPGDSISGAVEYVGGSKGQFQLTLRNNTKSVAVVVPSSYTQSPHAQCSSAQFIVEAPFENTVLPLADFGSINFQQCVATVNRQLGPIQASDRQSAPLSLVTNTEIPILMSTIATPTPLSPDAKSFTVNTSF